MNALGPSAIPPRSAWIGVDADAGPNRLAWSGRRALHGRAFQTQTSGHEPDSDNRHDTIGGPAASPPAKGRTLAGRHDAPPDPTLASRLAQGIRCLAAMPSRYCLYRMIAPPEIGAGRIRRLLPGMLDLELPFPIENCETRFALYETKDGRPRALALAVRHADIEARLETLQRQGCNPQILVPEPWTAWRYAEPVFKPYPEDALCVIRLQRNDEQTLILGRAGRMLACSTSPARDRERLLRLLIRSHDPSGDAPVVLLEVDTSAASPSDIDATGLTVLKAEDPDTWMARALAFCAGAEAGKIDLRGSRNIHPAVARQLHNAPVCLALALFASALLTFGTVFRTAREFERQAAEAQRKLRSEIDALAGYSVTRRGMDAIEAARHALEDRIVPAIEAWSDRDPLFILHGLFDTALESDVSLHDIRYYEKDWTLRASAQNREQAHAWIEKLANRGLDFTLSIDTAAAEPPKPVVFLIRKR